MVRRVACAMLVALVPVVAAAGSAHAAYQQLFYEWSAVGVQPGGAIWYYSGNYLGRTDWNPLRGVNALTRHQSTVYVRNPTGDIRSPGTTLYFIHGGQVRKTVPSYAWSMVGCGSIAPGGAVFGGCTTDPQYLGGFASTVPAQDRGTWAFLLCDAAGCYGGVGRDRTWTLW
ncbi:hypothetical protein HRbin27_01390 [bacterium HR27]|nr:hypothetical protein [Thermomicrobium sp.]GBD18890.1 hypothetical protein HRbin27_01390 [bacterium HR27]